MSATNPPMEITTCDNLKSCVWKVYEFSVNNWENNNQGCSDCRITLAPHKHNEWEKEGSDSAHWVLSENHFTFQA